MCAEISLLVSFFLNSYELKNAAPQTHGRGAFYFEFLAITKRMNAFPVTLFRCKTRVRATININRPEAGLQNLGLDVHGLRLCPIAEVMSDTPRRATSMNRTRR